MTLAAVWIEDTPGGGSPLCFASDSRTTPGPIEGVTKVVLFSREDLVGVWAGDYRYATLVVNHLDSIFTATDAARRRDIDVARLLARARETARQHLRSAMKPLVLPGRLNRDAQEPGKATVIVGGYSIQEAAFKVLRIDWNPGGRRWEMTVADVDPTRVLFIGDETNGARATARRARERRLPTAPGEWRAEPLVAIYGAIIDRNKSTIGGALQLAKAYRHGSSRSYGFRDPMRSDGVTVRGTVVSATAIRELEVTGVLADLSSWNVTSGYFGGPRIQASAGIDAAE